MNDDSAEGPQQPGISFRQARRNYVMHRDRRSQKLVRGWGTLIAVVVLAGLAWWTIR